jgi:hypothetical protein
MTVNYFNITCSTKQNNEQNLLLYIIIKETDMFCSVKFQSHVGKYEDNLCHGMLHCSLLEIYQSFRG